MDRLEKKTQNHIRRKHRIRAKVQGTTGRPRMTLSISNLHVSVQIIDDSKHITLAAATTIGKKMTGTMTEKAAQIGQEIAKKAKTAKVSKVVLDRNGKLYHGRVKALADAARAGGLEF